MAELSDIRDCDILQLPNIDLNRYSPITYCIYIIHFINLIKSIGNKYSLLVNAKTAMVPGVTAKVESHELN